MQITIIIPTQVTKLSCSDKKTNAISSPNTGSSASRIPARIGEDWLMPLFHNNIAKLVQIMPKYATLAHAERLVGSCQFSAKSKVIGKAVIALAPA